MDKIYITFGSSEYKPDMLRSAVCKTEPRRDKPNGLWASPKDAGISWESWCRSEKFRLSTLDESFEFTLSYGAKILEIHDPEDIIEYVLPVNERFFAYKLDHEALRQDYDGMELFLSDNYQALRWDKYDIFYTWDCDSIVIWNPDVIKPLKLSA